MPKPLFGDNGRDAPTSLWKDGKPLFAEMATRLATWRFLYRRNFEARSALTAITNRHEQL
jgi:hypothetical protein